MRSCVRFYRVSSMRMFGPATILCLMFGCGGSAVTVAPPAAVEVAVSQPLRREMTDSLEFTGSTAPAELVDVRARVTGFLEAVHFQPRAKVNKGDLLFTIDARPFQAVLDSAKAELLAKKAELVDREFEFNKVEGLMASGSATPDERVTARARLEATLASIAKSQAEVERAQLDLGFCRVTAPIHGRISRNLIDAGNIVTADATVLATIVNDDVIYAYFDASEREVLTLRSRGHRHRETGAGTASEPEPPPAYLALMTETGFPHEGAIDYVSPKLDVSTGTIQVRGRFPNPDGVLLAGLFVRVRVPVSEPYQALTVTERALASDQGQRYLLAVSAQNVVEYRPVQVGTLQDGLRVIGAGIAAEDWIIVSGIQRVRPGVTVTPNRTPMPTGPAVSSRAPSAPAPAPASQSEPAAKGGH